MITLLASGFAAAGSSLVGADEILRLGTLTPAAPTTPESPCGKILIGALADLGYAPGRNLALEARGAMGDIAKLPGLVEQLRTAGAQILVAQGYPAAVVGKDAGMPTVIFTGAGDPVATGLVASWAHPGGVVTTRRPEQREEFAGFAPQKRSTRRPQPAAPVAMFANQMRSKQS